VLGADVVVPEAPRLIQGELENLLRSRREGHFFVGGPLTPADCVLDLGADAVGGDVQALQHLAGDAFPLTDDA
jgi:hypothetical protein